jgi:hypothetical protein
VGQTEREILMWKKLLILSLSVAMLFSIAGCSSDSNANAQANSIDVDWEIAGTIVQQIAISDPADGTLIGPHSLINLSAQGDPDGDPGPAEITLLSKIAVPGTTGTTLTCELGYFPIGEFEQNDFIALFPDQDFLFASIDDPAAGGGGILCLDAATFGTTYFIVKMNITGGKGRFDGATGNLTGEGYGYLSFSSAGTLVGENGTLTGTIHFAVP